MKTETLSKIQKAFHVHFQETNFKEIESYFGITGIKDELFRCLYCQKLLDEKNVSLDHFNPKSRGGQNAFNNIVFSCERCNIAKYTDNGNQFISLIQSIGINPEAMESILNQRYAEVKAKFGKNWTI